MTPYFLHGAGYANLQILRREQSDGAYFPPGPWVKKCMYCLRDWAILAPSAGKQPTFSLHSVCCETCSFGYEPRNVPGSLIYNASSQTTDWDLLDDLPIKLVNQEFLVHLKYLHRLSFMLTNEDLNKLQLYRSRIVAGEQMPAEETKEAIRLMRADRQKAAERAKTSKSKSSSAAKAPPRDAGDLLGKLGIVKNTFDAS